MKKNICGDLKESEAHTVSIAQKTRVKNDCETNFFGKKRGWFSTYSTFS
jgi:hypothetical protein